MVVEWIVILLLLASPFVWISALVSARRFSEAAFKAAGRTRFSVTLLIVLTGVVGGTYYWAVIRREVTPHRAAKDPVPEGRYIDPSLYARQR